ncbi:hypothetical protein KP509_16G063700 [Ceratopteris richardii]|uniref:Acyl-[acyl-carrier-protein] hydrolase n=1 Tax=Ceratopteris richardii TaxID=49495 RepID=A0A8T2T2P0_CERRI|nr:hypothetical protein KP509_16G063700 [Ceratopteris richardii]
MSSIARSLIHNSLTQAEERQEWSRFLREVFPSTRARKKISENCNLHVRAVTSGIPKRNSHHAGLLNNVYHDLNTEAKTTRRSRTRDLQELGKNIREEHGCLKLPDFVKEEENEEEENATSPLVLSAGSTWFLDVAVVAVLAGAILAAVSEKEAIMQSQGLPSVKSSDGASGNGAVARPDKELAHQAFIDSIRRGKLIEKGFVYRQTFVVRSYEVGFDRTASIGTLANLFQETALNHVGMSDFVGDGMGTTHAMMRHRLIWVVTKMHIQIEEFPVWGDVVEIDSWVNASGKNGMRRDFIVRDCLTGHVRARATSHWAMMNQDSRKLSKMPDDVRAEISPYFLERNVMPEDSCPRIKRLDDSALYVKSDLLPRLHDMDMNQHVNHVKYISWVLESVPQSLLVAYELMEMTLEYRKECNHSDVVCSLTSPDSSSSYHVNDEATQLYSTFMQNNNAGLFDESLPPSIRTPHISTAGPIRYTHLLRLQADSTEVLRGRTAWRLKKRYYT